MSQTAPCVPAPATPSTRGRSKLGPYSRALRRGAIGGSIDGRSTTGRLIRDMERQLIDHVGGRPSVVQRLLIDRVIKIRLQLDSLDAKLASGDWTPHDSRTHAGLINGFRLALREIGVKGAAAPVPSLAEHLARLGAEQAARQAAGAAQNAQRATPLPSPEPVQSPAGVMTPAEPSPGPARTCGAPAGT